MFRFALTRTWQRGLEGADAISLCRLGSCVYVLNRGQLIQMDARCAQLVQTVLDLKRVQNQREVLYNNNKKDIRKCLIYTKLALLVIAVCAVYVTLFIYVCHLKASMCVS